MSFWKRAPKSDRMLFLWSMGCLVAAFAMLGIRNGTVAAKTADDEEFLRFVDVAAEVYNEIRTKYVDEIEGREVLEGALQGMFSRLDEHSQYLDPKMLDRLKKDTDGQFSGIGIHITMRQGLLTVIAPIPGSPSAALGIQPWDRIVEIEGKTTEGLTLQDAVDKLTGPSGTKVKIKVFREGSATPLDFEITRAEIKVRSVHYAMREDNIGYVRVARFSDSTAADMKKALLDLKSQGMKALIIDLRFDPGGLLREAIEVSELFVPKSEVVVSTKGRLRSQNKEYRSNAEPLVKVPMFVLVNEGSASASEIVAGALQDHKLAVVIGPAGKNSFGKGSVQTLLPLRHSMYEDENGNPKSSELRLTTAKYYTPSGRSIHHVGITPDIGVPLPDGHEAELLRHGLLGEATIPITVDEEKAIEEAKQKAQEAKEPKEPAAEGEQPNVVIQRNEAAEEEEAIRDQEPARSENGEPFYNKAKKPELSTKVFTDILLEEAVKQMKIYMILNQTNEGNKIAEVPAGDAVSMKK